MKKRKNIVLIFSAAVLIFSILTSSAWFVFDFNKIADVTPSDVEKPPIISILNNETSTLDILNLDGLQVGKPKCIVFCVTPSSAGLIHKYVLQLSYTTNLGENIDLYTSEYSGTAQPLTGSNAEEVTGTLPTTGDYVKCQSRTDSNVYYYYTLTGIKLNYQTIGSGYGYDGTEGSVTPENEAIYKTYKDVNGTNNFVFDSTPWLDSWNNNRGRYIFYALYVHWDTQPTQLASKETDVVYVSAKGIIDLESN